MISRRDLLLAPLVCLSLAGSRSLRAFPLSLPLGFQSYDVNRQLSEDFTATCRTLAGFGYQLVDYVWLAHNSAVSPAVRAMTAKEVRRAFDSAGLKCQNCHFSWTELHEQYEANIAAAHVLGVNSVVCQASSEHTKTPDGWKWHAQELNTLGKRTKGEGILTGYHNHPVEFKDLEGIVPFDLIVEGTDPELVQMQLDVGSVAAAGKDPVACLEKYPERYFSIHAKDVRDGTIGIAVGEGTLDWSRIFGAARKAPLRNYVVETGARPDVVIEKLKTSAAFLKEFSVQLARSESAAYSKR